MQAGRVSGGIHFHGHERSSQEGFGLGAPRQLPRDISDFVNRTDELHRLDELLPRDQDSRPWVYVIVGTAGAGKTSLALHWAHRAQEHFPDGQLYINLRGYDPGEPVSALEALHRFLVALGVPSAALPTDVDTAAAMYRSALADRSVLIVLDNAGSVSQVRPLLPGGSRCLTVVTSRSRLSGLAVHDGARRLTVGTLTEPECVLLLRTVTAGYRPEDDVDKLIELARLCGRLPLALRIAAERAVCHPHMRIDDLVAELRDRSALWDALSLGEEGNEGAVRSVFAWSYRALSPDCARLFRLLGLHPGADLGIGAAAALAEVDIRRSRQMLDGLVAAHMLEQTSPDRYEFHDLLRAYAIDQARLEENDRSRAAAVRRMLDWYLHTAAAAQSWIMPVRDPVPLDARDDRIAIPSFSDYDQAVEWCEREQANFLPAVHAAVEYGFDRHAWRLALVLWSATAPSTPAMGWLSIGLVGLGAAGRANERGGEASLLRSLGFTYVKINDLEASLENHSAALTISRDLGDRRGEAASLNAIGLIYSRWRRLAEAERHLELAGAIYGELGAAHWSSVVLANLASVHLQAGQLVKAADNLQQVMDFQRRRGNKRSMGNALHLLSGVHVDLGEFEEALRAAQEAVELALDLRSHVLEGYWLLTLGHAQAALGQHDDALVSFHRSATLHRRLGDRSREALAWHGAGDAYRRGGRDDEAVGFFRRAAAVQRELGYPWHEAMALDGLAAAVPDDDAEQSRRCWAEALELIAGYGDSRALEVRRRIETHLAELP
ncbi:NB-ARC domain-containing protein [Sinosporangium album]|uniref:NB-ARC domain-containing protein n=1 Tax=Sinosporangium album TaxID=504805 RepID=A0A1G8BPU7_9ACTN|nr:tetratricopeptide repeat protein [Sinosporangium album]SDH35266.1 NB-ARC domain-containing protein [Sinosporangium album]